MNSPCPRLKVKKKLGRLEIGGQDGEGEEGRRLEERWVLILENPGSPVRFRLCLKVSGTGHP